MKVSDRALGYLTVLTLLLVFAVITIGMWDAHHESATTILVDFDELGSLQPEDPVVIRGYNVGTIGDVKWLGDRARVEIKFNEPVVIREGTIFNNVNYALMGQRRLEITPSKTGKVLPNDYIHTGIFEPGIAEALRLMDNVNEQLTAIREMVHLIVEGDSANPSAQEMFEKVMTTIEKTLENSEKMVVSLQPTINKIFSQVDSASNTLIDVTMQADTAVKSVTNVINEKISLAEDAIKKISEGAKRTNEIIASIEDNALNHKLLTTGETLEKVNDLVNKINDLLIALDTKGVKILDDNGQPVKLVTWKNINLIGKTAREKAAERAAKGESLP
ncbi:MAG: MlaD family protein [Fibrobacter sp.]|nr:MlaD family protein [Fibrobacter sp.]